MILILIRPLDLLLWFGWPRRNSSLRVVAPCRPGVHLATVHSNLNLMEHCPTRQTRHSPKERGIRWRPCLCGQTGIQTGLCPSRTGPAHPWSQGCGQSTPMACWQQGVIHLWLKWSTNADLMMQEVFLWICCYIQRDSSFPHLSCGGLTSFGCFLIVVCGIWMEAGCSPRLTFITSESRRRAATRASLTDATGLSLSPPSAHSWDDPPGSHQDSLSLQRRFHWWIPEPWYCCHAAKGRRLLQPWPRGAAHHQNDRVGLFSPSVGWCLLSGLRSTSTLSTLPQKSNVGSSFHFCNPGAQRLLWQQHRHLPWLVCLDINVQCFHWSSSWWLLHSNNRYLFVWPQ